MKPRPSFRRSFSGQKKELLLFKRREGIDCEISRWQEANNSQPQNGSLTDWDCDLQKASLLSRVSSRERPIFGTEWEGRERGAGPKGRSDILCLIVRELLWSVFHCHAKNNKIEWVVLVKKLGYFYPDFYDFVFPLDWGIETMFHQEPITRSLQLP